VGIKIDPKRLRLELARRGWTGTRLATEAGVSSPTVSAALAGKAIAAQSLSLMAAALGRTPPVPGIDALLGQTGLE
jgi:transcriptional regulator with XRE-family HTH domain